MTLNYKTYENLLLDIKQNLYKIPPCIDLVVGIPRSGMIPAYMIGFALNTRVCSLDEFINGLKISHGARPIKESETNILVVDDSLWSGNSMKAAKKAISAIDLTGKKLYYTAVYVYPDSENIPDIALTTLPSPRMFQWNYMNHSNITQSCFDIDGVLCVDPTEEENDDGEKYRNFILNAKPLYIPHYKIHALVTSRLEKYRKETEEWLKKNNVQYEYLYMLDLPSKEDRIRLKMHGKFKAEIYKKLENTMLFYESNRDQAFEIAGLTGKTVFCAETDELINIPLTISYQKPSTKQKIKRLVKKILRVCIPFKTWRNTLKRIYKKLKSKRVNFLHVNFLKTRNHKKLNRFEIYLTKHCNLNCKWCGVFSPLAERTYINSCRLNNDIQRLSVLTNKQVEHIRILGGEPLLHPQAAEILGIVRTYFPQTRIELVTNGILLRKQSDLFWEKCQTNNIEITISHYPINIQYDAVQHVAKKFNVNVHYDSQEAKFMWKMFLDLDGRQNYKKSFKECWQANRCVALQNGKLFTCTVIPNINHFNEYFKTNLRVCDDDSIDIYKAKNITKILKNLRKPKKFCRYCKSNMTSPNGNIPWDVSKKEVSEWT
ncbi:MAG: radical SAM protein [Spirochaetaceae bacterium]|jgi:uncharacterized HAD superfamily protein/MoaA/NifB/PqqE/SkfB family radical SAM enzyme/hypoxanthine phosphoribosyltransferase|nr:radical SAM protein [Spirochaetaceae bacterium]